MIEDSPLPYKKALPLLLARSNMSYRDLDKKTGKSASYWSQTLTGKAAVPRNPEVYERLAEVFGTTPFFFAEYGPARATRLVLNDPVLAYDVARASGAWLAVTYMDGFNIASRQRHSRVPALAGADMAVVVKGNGLSGARLNDGDLVYLTRRTRAGEGDLILARCGEVRALGLLRSDGGKDQYIMVLSGGTSDKSEMAVTAIEGVEVAVVKGRGGNKRKAVRSKT